MSDTTHDEWDGLARRLSVLRTAISRCRSVNVNTSTLKGQAKELVQHYFRQARPLLLVLGIAEEFLSPIDTEMQEVLRLSNSNCRRTYYAERLKEIESYRMAIETQRELLLSQKAAKSFRPVARTIMEEAILTTLQKVVPTAALSYEQGSHDLCDANRVSFRGVANEFRECLREVLDHLAPDKDVVAQKDFKLEENQKKPTMKQKVRYILRARGQPSTSVRSPEEAVSTIDACVAGLARSIYERSSISSHVTTSRGEVVQMRMYVDTVLAELLEIHTRRVV